MKQSKQLQLDRNICEYIRGIAIVFVVLGHILGGQFHLISAHATSLLGMGGVTMFLLLSGYGLFQSYESSGIQFQSYWEKKLQKVFLPYGIITVIFYIYLQLCGNEPGLPTLLLNVLCMDYTRAIDGTMWYLSFLLLWYAVFFCVFYFNGPMIVKIGMLFLVGGAFSNYIFKDLFDQCAWQFSTNAFAFPCGVGLGYLLDLMNQSRISDKWRARLRLFLRIVILSGSLAVLVLGLLQIVQVAYWKYGMAMFVTLYYLLSLPKKEIKVLKWLGASSFIIYLIEGKLIFVWGRYEFLQENPAVYILSYAVATVAVVYMYRFGSSCYRRLACQSKKN